MCPVCFVNHVTGLYPLSSLSRLRERVKGEGHFGLITPHPSLLPQGEKELYLQ